MNARPIVLSVLFACAGAIGCTAGQDLGSTGPGELIAYVEQLPLDKGLFVADRDGSNSRMIHTGASVQSPSWSPDGLRLAFVQMEMLYVIDLDGQNLSRIVPGTLGAVGAPRWSPDGQRIMFHGGSGGDGVSRLYVVDIDGGEPTIVAGPHASNGAWSPDGTQIAYQQGTDLYVVEADGAGAHRIVGPLNEFYTPGTSWSHDGSMVAYSVGDFEADVWTIDPSGGAPQRRTTAAGGEYSPSFSPDNTKLAMYHFQDQTNYGIYQLDLASGTLSVLIPKGEDPAYQP